MRSTDRRALLVAPMLPATTGNGLAIRTALFTEALGQVATTDLLVIPVFGSAGDPAWAAGRSLDLQVIDPQGREDTQYRLLSLVGDAEERLRAFRRYGRPSLEARLSQPVLADVRRLAAERHYDLVHVTRGYLMTAGRATAGDSVLTVDLDEDDAWSWRSLGAIRNTPEAQGWAQAEAAAADLSLRREAPHFAASFISGPVDGRRLARRHPGLRPIVVPNPAPALPALPRRDDGRNILFVGSFGYAPNVDGLGWFIDAVWPRVRLDWPEARLRVVGRNVPAQFAALDGRDGIEIVGTVEDVRAAYASATLAIAPLRVGGGTRIKLIEAAAYDVPIIATSLAARGLAFGHTRGMWIADSVDAFAGAIIAARDDAPERGRRAAHAEAVVERRHGRAHLVEQLACRFAALLAR